jgi:hypothetical protein
MLPLATALQKLLTALLWGATFENQIFNFGED